MTIRAPVVLNNANTNTKKSTFSGWAGSPNNTSKTQSSTGNYSTANITMIKYKYKQANYSLRRPPKLIIPKAVIRY